MSRPRGVEGLRYFDKIKIKILLILLIFLTYHYRLLLRLGSGLYTVLAALQTGPKPITCWYLFCLPFLSEAQLELDHTLAVVVVGGGVGGGGGGGGGVGGGGVGVLPYHPWSSTSTHARPSPLWMVVGWGVKLCDRM